MNEEPHTHDFKCVRLHLQKNIVENMKNDTIGVGKMDLQVGDVVTLKKPHPCGSKDWELLRVGMDFRLKCMGCGHQVMMERKVVEKNVRGIKKA